MMRALQPRHTSNIPTGQRKKKKTPNTYSGISCRTGCSFLPNDNKYEMFFNDGTSTSGLYSFHMPIVKSMVESIQSKVFNLPSVRNYRPKNTIRQKRKETRFTLVQIHRRD